jgi:uncharacterized protein (TIGR02611 family)
LSDLTISPRAHLFLARLDAWAHRGPLRSALVRLGVTIAGPLVVLVGVAMLVLPGPGLVVMALGLGLLALEYPWARTVLLGAGRLLTRAREAVLPKGASGGRRLLGVAAVGAFLIAGFVSTTAITAAISAYTFL